MRISEILSLTQEKPLNKIAKEHLNIGEKLAREALKKSGAVSQKGKRGWLFKGPEENLEKSIYDFAEVKAKKDNANVNTNQTKNESRSETLNKTTNEVTSERKRASFDIDKELLKRLKVASVMEEKNIYEMVEEAIFEYLDKKNQ